MVPNTCIVPSQASFIWRLDALIFITVGSCEKKAGIAGRVLASIPLSNLPEFKTAERRYWEKIIMQCHYKVGIMFQKI